MPGLYNTTGNVGGILEAFGNPAQTPDEKYSQMVSQNDSWAPFSQFEHVPKAEVVRTPEEARAFYGDQHPDVAGDIYDRPGSTDDEVVKKWKEGKYKQLQSQVASGRNAPQPAQQAPQKSFKTVGDIIDFEPKNGDEYELKRSAIQSIRGKILESTSNHYSKYGVDPSQLVDILKLKKESLDENGLSVMKPWSESKAYQSASELFNRAGYQQNAFSISQLRNQIIDARKMLAGGAPKEEVQNYLKVNIPKILQSLGTGQSDAVQAAEWTRLAPELESIFDVAPHKWPSLLQDKTKIADLFGRQPEDFINKAERVYDAAAKAFNRHYDASVRVNGQKNTDSLIGAMRFDPISKDSSKLEGTYAEKMLRGAGITPYAAKDGNPEAAFSQYVGSSRNTPMAPTIGRPVRMGEAPALAPQLR